MKKTFIRILALLLVLVMMMTVFVSCSKDEAPEDTQNNSVSTDLTTADILGFDKQDNGGKKFKVFLNNSYPVNERDFYVASSTENNLSKAIYERNVACEEYLGITLEFDRQPGANGSGVPQMLDTQIKGNSCDYDMVLITLGEGIGGNYINIYKNVMKMDYIDLEHDWWVQDMVDQASINEQLYFLTGDACLSTYSYIGCVLANLAVADEWQLDVDLYQTVKDGDWTLDEMFRLYKLVGSDDNNSGVMDAGTETYGLCWHNIYSRLMWSSCNMELVVRQPDGTFKLRDTLDVRMTDFASKMKTEFDDIHSNYLYEDNDMISDFVNDRVFLVTTCLGRAEDMKVNNMESPFAVLPMPKYDDAQEDYISVNIAAYNTIYFPASVQSPELCAQVAEFMGYYGKENVVPEYYDVTLKYKSNDVSANIEMLDLIRDKLRVVPNESFGSVKVDGLGSVLSWIQMTSWTTSGDRFYTTPASYWERNAGTIAEKLNAYVLQYFQ